METPGRPEAQRSATAAPRPETVASNPQEAALAPARQLSLEEALRLVRERQPALAVQAFETAAAHQRLVQAGLRPNPELGVEIENALGGRPLDGFDRTETSVWLSQRLELGGKRGARQDAARAAIALAEWDLEAAAALALARTRRDFYALLGAQERLALAVENQAAARQAAEATAERVRAGKAVPLEHDRAAVELGLAGAEVQDAAAGAAAARHALAADWGADTPHFERAAGALAPALEPPPELSGLLDLLQDHPAVARWPAEREQRRAALELARSNAHPDLDLTAGARRLEEFDTQSFLMGVSLPLPLWNRNQGAIGESRLRLAQVEEQQRAAESALRAELSAAHARWISAGAALAALREQVLPAAESALRGVEQAYELGRFGLLDVLDARRRFLEARRRELEAREALAGAQATVEGLVAAARPARQ